MLNITLFLGIITLSILLCLDISILGCFKMGKIEINERIKIIILVIINGSLLIRYIPIKEALMIPR
jgi:hypothetical protein